MDIVSEHNNNSHWPRRNFRNSIIVSGVRVGYWISHLWQDMRRKSPVAVQHWVDSLPSPIRPPAESNACAEVTVLPSKSQKESNKEKCEEEVELKPSNNGVDVLQDNSIVKSSSFSKNVTDNKSAAISHSTPVRIPRRGTIVREASLPSDSPQRRRLLLRDSSFQSDDAVSRCSSVDSLLESRRPDPEAVLLGLGFGPTLSQTDLSRIPQRFLGPSKVKGVNTEKFLKQQQLQREMHETGVWGYRGLTGDPHSPPSHIVAKIIERIHSSEQQQQGLDCIAPDSNNLF